ncbi:MAG: hypothetical protein GX564_01910 [Oligosphaeraceae bacterium]|nr:hypothetical protein [Oligosphaeraceae bacterium]
MPHTRQFFYALALTVCAGFSLLAQNAADGSTGASAAGAAPEPVFAPDGSTVQLGEWTARNLWLRRGTGVSSKDSDFWRHFMHGLRDDKGIPVAWPQLFNSPDEAQKWLAGEAARLQCPNIKTSNFPVLLLDGPHTLVLPKPVLPLSSLSALKGRNLRFYLWLKGENCGTGSLWDNAPTVVFSLKDGLDNLISTTESLFKTRGTFPWFCYYIEVPIPGALNTTPPAEEAENADQSALLTFNQGNGFLSSLFGNELVPPETLPSGGGLYLTLKNRGGGKAFFSTLSWENLGAPKDPPRSSWTDAVSGSRAPNPDYDELPMHIFFGLDPDKPWNFLHGNHATPDITSIEGLKKYLSSTSHDWFHCLYGVANLGYIHETGTILKQCREFEAGWTEVLLDHLLRWQDLRTGLWGIGGTPNLLISQAVVEKCFSPAGLRRSDQPLRETSWLAVRNTALPNPELLVESILSCRVQDAAGRPRGWNRFAFQDQKLGQEQRYSLSDLGSTCAAVQLLAQIGAQQGSPALQKTIQSALYDTWEFVLQNFFSQEYLWRQTDISWAVTTPAYMLKLLNALPWLEQRSDHTLPKPKCSVQEQPGEKIRVTWEGQKNRYASLRVYAAPAALGQGEISEKHVVAILNRNSSSQFTTDPLLLMGKILAAAGNRWGITAASEGADYIAAKMALLPRNLTVGDGGNELIFPIPGSGAAEGADAQAAADTGPLKYYVTAVTPYNVMAGLTEITLSEGAP